MRSIALINQKGGVGKTTSTVSLAAALSRAGKRVAVLDLDPQAHATMHFGVELGPDDASVYDLFIGRASAGDTLRQVGENLSLIPSHIDLVAADTELATRPERELVLRRALDGVLDQADFLLVDCPPSLGLLTINALATVEEVIIPLQPHFLALQGLGKLLETVTLVRGVLNPALRISGVILCLYETGTRLAQEVTTDVRSFLEAAQPEDPWFGARLFETAIRRNVKLAESPSFGQTVFEYAPSCRGAEDYNALAAEVLGTGTSCHESSDDDADHSTNEPSDEPMNDSGAKGGEVSEPLDSVDRDQSVIVEASALAERVVPMTAHDSEGAMSSALGESTPAEREP